MRIMRGLRSEARARHKSATSPTLRLPPPSSISNASKAAEAGEEAADEGGEVCAVMVSARPTWHTAFQSSALVHRLRCGAEVARAAARGGDR